MTKLLALDHTNENIIKALENASQNDPAGKIRELASIRKIREFRKRNYR
jgi:hypothetical protein